MIRVLTILVFCSIAAVGNAQFSRDFLANQSYWGNGKAEFDIYDAQLMREGEPRSCEMLIIFSRDKDAGITMNQIWTAPLGLFVEQGSVAAHWRANETSIENLSFVGNSGFGNISKFIATSASGWVFANGSERSDSKTALPAASVFYDELPLRVRTIDRKQKSLEIQLSAPLANSKTIEFKTAKISWSTVEKSIQINVQHAGGLDLFRIDQDFPFLLREWQMADGSKLKLKRSLKVDYWNYSKSGDRERAFKDPMLRHPD